MSYIKLTYFVIIQAARLIGIYVLSIGVEAKFPNTLHLIKRILVRFPLFLLFLYLICHIQR